MNLKKEYIYEKIKSRGIDHNLISVFIKNEKIPYTENMNGIYFNLSLLDDTIINKLYNNINSIEKINCDMDTKLNNIKTIINKDKLNYNTYRIQLIDFNHNLTENELFIIEKSKMNNLI